eukprot:480873-Prymnesium_polylepis.3
MQRWLVCALCGLPARSPAPRGAAPLRRRGARRRGSARCSPACRRPPALQPFVPPSQWKMKLVMRKLDRGTEMGGPHAPDSSQRSQLQRLADVLVESGTRWLRGARASEVMPLTLAGNGVLYAGGRLLNRNVSTAVP